MTTARMTVRLRVNGVDYEREVETRLLLSDFLRHDLRLTGTHVACAHGVCGACTVFLDGSSARSCLTLAVQADGAEITTVEGLTAPEDPMGPVQEAFRENHALQCGFCTSGFLVVVTEFLAANPDPTDEEIGHALSGNICRCTGYVNIRRAVRAAAKKLRELPSPVAAGDR